MKKWKKGFGINYEISLDEFYFLKTKLEKER